MPASASYTFYGVVEDPFANDFITVDPVAFGYTAGQKITGSLTLLGAIGTLWSSGPEERNLSTQEFSEVGFYSSRQPPGIGHRPISPLICCCHRATTSDRSINSAPLSSIVVIRTDRRCA